MNARSIWISIAGALGIAAVASLISVSSARAASPDAHPDFVWWPTATSSNRLYVGGLSGNIGSSDADAHSDLRKITID